MLVSIVITQIVAKKNLRYASLRQETVGELTGIVEEYYNGRNVIKAYNHEAQSLKQVSEAAEKNRIANLKADFLTNCVNPLIRLLTRLANVVIAIIAGKAMLDGTMSVGVVQAFFQYVNQNFLDSGNSGGFSPLWRRFRPVSKSGGLLCRRTPYLVVRPAGFFLFLLLE